MSSVHMETTTYTIIYSSIDTSLYLVHTLYEKKKRHHPGGGGGGG